MNIFDKNFHDVDPKTSRPFSSGHPDGVWVICIFYGLVIAAPIIGVIASIFIFIFGGFNFYPLLGSLAATAISIFLFLPPIILLFERSEKVFYIFFFYLSVFGIAAFLSYSLNTHVFYGSLLLFLMQAWATYYTWGLKKDQLIGRNLVNPEY